MTVRVVIDSASTMQVHLDLYLPARKRVVKTIELYGPIDPEKSTFKILGTKVHLFSPRKARNLFNFLLTPGRNDLAKALSDLVAAPDEAGRRRGIARGICVDFRCFRSDGNCWGEGDCGGTGEAVVVTDDVVLDDTALSCVEMLEPCVFRWLARALRQGGVSGCRRILIFRGLE